MSIFLYQRTTDGTKDKPSDRDATKLLTLNMRVFMKIKRHEIDSPRTNKLPGEPLKFIRVFVFLASVLPYNMICVVFS